MNPRIEQLHAYPFERLRQLFANITPNPALSHITLGIGEPRHATPTLILDAYQQALHDPLHDLSRYPATGGAATLRQAFARWLMRRYAIEVNADTQTLPVNGSREALFAITQAVVDSKRDAVVICPNPFYQIYEGATVLAGATPFYVNADDLNNFVTNWDSVDESIWQRTQMVFVCTPNNPTGAVMSLANWKTLFELSDRYDFVIASDECYGEIYCGTNAPIGCLQAAKLCDRFDFHNLVMFTSLSKRSNAPGMRSGFVAGDARILKKFLLYRTYQGCAMAPPVQAASVAAWDDEEHVAENRRQYKQKFDQVVPVLAEVLDVTTPEAGFFLWAKIPDACNMNDEEFALELYRQQNVTVLPGSYLARKTNEGNPPGFKRIRMALVAPLEDCLQAAQRIKETLKTLQK